MSTPVNVPESELIGPAGVAPVTTPLIALGVFMVIGTIGSNYPKVGKPLMVIVASVLILEAWRATFGTQ
jgi:hypothetical protein